MFDEVGLPKQRKCVVAFIDFLGVSHKIKIESQSALNSIWLFYQYITEEIKKYKDINYKIFSDNILICEEVKEENFKQTIFNILQIVEKAEIFMMKMGALFTRGAVVVGDLHFSENFVYGNALLEAHDIESNKAKYPRVIIDESVLRIIKDEKLFIVQDKDGQYFYDFLHAKIQQGEERLSQELSTFQGNILSNLMTKNVKPETIEKMEWTINYFNDTCAKNGLKHKITVAMLSRFGVNTKNIHISNW